MARPPETIHLNGDALPRRKACKRMRGLLNRPAIAAAGGVLVKAALCGQQLHLHLQPNFIDGQRTYHFDMPLPEVSGPAIRGDIRAGGSLAMLFGPEAFQADPAAMAEACRVLAAVLVEGGLDGRWRLEPICRQALEEIEAYRTAPTTIGEMAEAKTDV
jgi:hypothetical protein